MRSIQYRGTGRFYTGAERLNADETVCGHTGEIQVAQAVRSTQGMEILNAVGDVNDNATGFQIAIDTLTYIKKQVTTQKFYEVPVADFVPVDVGDGAFSQALLTNLTFSNSDDFEKGNIRSGESGARLAQADASIASKTIKVINWAKEIGYTIFDIQQALYANNWDIIEAKHRSRMKNWQLGLQEIGFLGSKVDDGVLGLLTQTAVNTNTSLITAPLSGLNAADFNNFVASLISTYFANTNSTAMPTHFVIPYSDFLGLQTLTPGTVGTYPLPKIEYLLMAFKAATRNPGFHILPLAYADAANNLALRSINKNIYTLYRYDRESIRMDIPVDYTTTQPNSMNNFSFNDVAYGQYTGVGVYRNLELMYFEYTPAS